MSLCVRKPTICLCENKDADQLRGNREADQRFVFATRIVQSLFFLNPKFQASSHLLCLYSPVCVGPGRKPKLLVFSRTGSYLDENLLIYLAWPYRWIVDLEVRNLSSTATKLGEQYTSTPQSTD